MQTISISTKVKNEELMRSNTNKIYFFEKNTYVIDTNPGEEQKNIFYMNPKTQMIFHQIHDAKLTKQTGLTGLEYLLVQDKIVPHFLQEIPKKEDTQIIRQEFNEFIQQYNDLVSQGKYYLNEFDTNTTSKAKRTQMIISIHKNIRAGIKYHAEPVNDLVNELFEAENILSKPNRFWRRNLPDLTKKEHSWIE